MSAVAADGAATAAAAATKTKKVKKVVKKKGAEGAETTTTTEETTTVTETTSKSQNGYENGKRSVSCSSQIFIQCNDLCTLLLLLLHMYKGCGHIGFMHVGQISK